MKKFIKLYWIPVLSFIVLFVGLITFPNSKSILFDFYSKNLRLALFTGFFTIGGFLLSLKTFILIKLKEELFDSEAYNERHKEACALHPSSKISFYGPLKRLGNFLFHCVLLALLTSVSQFSVGIINNHITTAFCIAIAGATISLVFMAWWNIRKNLNVWFEILENSKTGSGGNPD